MKSDNTQRKYKIDYLACPIYEEPNMTGSPERNMLMAVLERAILDYVGNDQKDVQAAEHWIFAPRDNEDFEPFSFAWVCSELDLEPNSIEKIIQEMPKRG